MSFYIGNTEITGVYIGGTEITSAYVGSDLIYSTGIRIRGLQFIAEQANSTIGLSSISTAQTLEYTFDGVDWSGFTVGDTITLANTGDTVYMRGILSDNNSTGNYTNFTMTGAIKLKGNINYLFNYSNLNTPLKNYCGCYLFSGCTALSSVSSLKLPATTLAEGCYMGMFKRCTGITTVPELPATTLARECYYGMFDGCYNLTTAPALPATRLAFECYGAMFFDCTSLTSAPALPATTLAEGCYSQMFQGCTSLTTAPELPATTLANYCYEYMFCDCPSLTTAPALPATTLAIYCYKHMFYTCTGLITAPALEISTLVEGCYYAMFEGCSNLSYVKCLATDISASDCTTDWVSGVTSTGTFVKDASMTGWTTGNSGIPSGWTIQNNSFKWTPTSSGLLGSDGVTYSGSTWSFGTDADGDYYCNNGMGQMIPLDYQIDGTERFRIKFKYDHEDGRQLLGNAPSYNDGQFTYRFFIYAGQSFDLGSISEGHHRISTNRFADDVLLDYEIGNYYIKEYNGSVIVQDTPIQYDAPSDNMLYVGTDGVSTIKIYQIEILQ